MPQTTSRMQYNLWLVQFELLHFELWRDLCFLLMLNIATIMKWKYPSSWESPDPEAPALTSSSSMSCDGHTPCQVIPHLVSHFVQPHQFCFCQLSDNFLGPVTSQSGQWHLISVTELCKLTGGDHHRDQWVTLKAMRHHSYFSTDQIKSNQIKRQVAIPTQSHGHRNRCPTYQAPWNQNPCCTHVAPGPGPNEQVCPGALDRGQTNNIKGQPKQTTDMQSI